MTWVYIRETWTQGKEKSKAKGKEWKMMGGMEGREGSIAEAQGFFVSCGALLLSAGGRLQGHPHCNTFPLHGLAPPGEPPFNGVVGPKDC